MPAWVVDGGDNRYHRRCFGGALAALPDVPLATLRAAHFDGHAAVTPAEVADLDTLFDAKRQAAGLPTLALPAAVAPADKVERAHRRRWSRPRSPRGTAGQGRKRKADVAPVLMTNGAAVAADPKKKKRNATAAAAEADVVQVVDVIELSDDDDGSGKGGAKAAPRRLDSAAEKRQAAEAKALEVQAKALWTVRSGLYCIIVPALFPVPHLFLAGRSLTP